MNILLNKLRFARVEAGFTLFDMLTAVAILCLSGSILIPSFLGFLENYQLDIAQDQVHQAVQKAQSKAIRTSTAWRFGIREHNGSIHWSVYQDGLIPTEWTTLSHSLKIDDETTLRKSSLGIYSAKFDYKGNAKILGRVTLSGKQYSSAKRCVIISTLVGNTRRGKQHSKPNASGKYCY